MAVTKVIDFDAVAIKNASIQFIKAGVATPGARFGCLGSVEGETEIKELIKMCEGIEAKKKVVPLKMTLSVSAHIDVEVARNLFGLKNEGLKPGIYSYGTDSKGLNFIFTADVIDEFEDVVKLIAFPNASNNSGLQIKVENGQDEVALLEMEFTVLADVNNKFYYEAFVGELTDSTIATKWHTAFTPELVKAVPIP